MIVRTFSGRTCSLSVSKPRTPRKDDNFAPQQKESVLWDARPCSVFACVDHASAPVWRRPRPCTDKHLMVNHRHHAQRQVILERRMFIPCHLPAAEYETRGLYS